MYQGYQAALTRRRMHVCRLYYIYIYYTVYTYIQYIYINLQLKLDNWTL